MDDEMKAPVAVVVGVGIGAAIVGLYAYRQNISDYFNPPVKTSSSCEVPKNDAPVVGEHHETPVAQATCGCVSSVAENAGEISCGCGVRPIPAPEENEVDTATIIVNNNPPTVDVDIFVIEKLHIGTHPISGAHVKLNSMGGAVQLSGETDSTGHVHLKVPKIRTPGTFELEVYHKFGVPQYQRRPIMVADVDKMVTKVEFHVGGK